MKNQGEPWETLLRESITKDLKKLCCMFFSVSSKTLDDIQDLNAFIRLLFLLIYRPMMLLLELYVNCMVKHAFNV